MTSNRKVLVTGATGFTGGHLARTLKKRGDNVVALVRSETSNAASALAAEKIELVVGDVGHADDILKASAGCSHIYHIAAVYRTANHPDSYYYKVNANSVDHVLAAAEHHGVERIVVCSTCGVHGDVLELPANENTPFNPGDIYQRSKLAGERKARDAMAKGVPVSVVRPTGIYGPGDTRFLKLFKAIQSGTFWMFGSGEIAYHMTYIDDMIDGILLAGDHPNAVGETFLIASDDYTTLNQLVQLTAEVLGVRPPKGKMPIGPLLAAATVCEALCKPFGIDPPLHRRRCEFFTKARAFSNAKAKELLGFEPRIPLEEGLQRTARWYQETGLLKEPRMVANQK